MKPQTPDSLSSCLHRCLSSVSPVLPLLIANSAANRWVNIQIQKTSAGISCSWENHRSEAQKQIKDIGEMRKTRHWKLFRRRMLLEATMGCRYWRWHHWGCRLSNLSCRYHAVAPAMPNPVPCTLVRISTGCYQLPPYPAWPSTSP